MDKKETMVLYVSHYEAIKTLPEKEQLITLKSIIEYSLYGIIPELSGIPNLVFSMARPNIDASNKRRDASRANGVKGGPHGEKGGRPKSQETPTITPSETPNITPNKPQQEPLEKPQTKPLAKPLNVNVKENVNANVNVNVKANAKDKKKLIEKKSNFEVLETSAEQIPKSQPAEVAEGAPTKTFRQWAKADLASAIQPHVAKHGRDLCNDFFAYWAEPTANGKIRVNLETAWDTARRLGTWRRNNFSKPTQSSAAAAQIPIPRFKSQPEAEQWVIDTHYHGRRELSALGMGISLTTEDGQPRPIEDIRKEVEIHMTSYQL